MAWVGYIGKKTVVARYGHTFWNLNKFNDDSCYVKVDHPAQIEAFKQDPGFSVRKSLPEKVSEQAKTLTGKISETIGKIGKVEKAPEPKPTKPETRSTRKPGKPSKPRKPAKSGKTEEAR